MSQKIKFDNYTCAKTHADTASKRASFRKLKYKCKPVQDTDGKWYISIICNNFAIGALWK